MVDDKFKEPSRDTRVRIQGDKDTARGDGSTDDVRPPWKIGQQLNDFVLEELLGKGSSGFVYRALDQLAQRRCALKLLLPGTPEDLVRNKLGFRRMMSIQHPSLMRVDRIHQLGEYIALSMEEVDGDTLTHAVRKLKQVDVDAAYQQLLHLTRQYAAGLAAMHVNGYVHRDIKPQNLMVDRNANGRVIDYGLVGTFDPETDPHGYRHYLAGTPRYFSPETLWDQYYLPAGDIFSLGMVMLEALQMISWPAQTDPSQVQRSETSPRDDAEKISEAIEGLDRSVPDDLRSICLEMLQLDPGDRPTAMRVARFGLSTSAPVAWPQENPIIGRQREVAEITAWLDSVYSGAVGRLHLTGPSGIGKTRLIDDVEKYIRSMRWGQVFRARCRSREDQPLQAFDQLCDAIANRYKQGDREPLQLDPVSATILHTIFPVLKNIIRCSMQIAPAGTTTERLDALEAAARMSVELRKVGPLFLIIDDAQWADRDSLNALDRLQRATGDIGLGIITVSRDPQDRQRVPASCHLALQPLSTEEAVSVLAGAAATWGVKVNDSTLLRLAEAAEGIPFRLHELADEFRGGGALSQIDESEGLDASVSQLGEIDWLWQKRASRLSEDAYRVLLFVVTAGCRVSTQQLGKLTGLGDAVDAAVSELAQQRLVADDATGGQCIQMVHDQVADGLVETLTGEEKRKAHQAWAALLIREDNPEKLAARIAGHFIAAGEPWRAVSYAILAAEDAERLVAMTEAARWHAMVIDHVDGKEKVARMRHAARCFYEADHPIEAAEYYQRLSEHVDLDEKIECQLKVATLSIRSGHFAEVRQQLQSLAKTLGLPRPKPSLFSLAVLNARSIQTAAKSLLGGKQVLDAKRACQDSQAPAATARNKQRLELCLSLARPMSMFDSTYSEELNLAALSLAAMCGTPVQRVQAVVGRAVDGCYDRGARRSAGETMLSELRQDVEQMGQARASGDLWAGIAFSHALSCRWQKVPEAVRLSIDQYNKLSDSSGFEIAHTRWIELWAHWHLGRWDALVRISDQMFDDAIRRNDLFQRLILTEGYGCSAWLARDRTTELDRIRQEHRGAIASPFMQMFHVSDWITAVQRALYEGKFDQAWKRWRSLEPDLRKPPYSRLQLIRVIRGSLGLLAALHKLRGEESLRWRRRAGSLIRQLRRERLPYTSLLADLYEGLLLLTATSRFQADTRAARHYLRQASNEARKWKLKPFQLAADDALAQIETGRPMGFLRERMQNQGVERPLLLERLYTVGPSSS